MQKNIEGREDILNGTRGKIMNKELEAFERIKKGVDDNIWDGNEYDDLDIIENALKALEEYHKIEEELGIDLITLLKVQTTGAYFKGADRKWKPTTYYDEKCFVVMETEIYRFYFKDYGKTWSLNKEDLQ